MRIKKYMILLLMGAFVMTQPVHADKTETTEISTEETTENSSTEETSITESKTEDAKITVSTATAATTEITTEAPKNEHGEIVNTSSGEYLIQGTTQINKVTDAIDSIEDNTKKEEIMRIRYMYNGLTMAQKARVPNESTLYGLEKKHDITYDYS